MCFLLPRVIIIGLNMNGIDVILALEIIIARILHHVNNIICMMQKEWVGIYGQCGSE